MSSKPLDDNRATDSFSWDQPPLNESSFHARACMLAVASQQQDLSNLQTRARHDKERSVKDEDQDCSDSESDAETILPRKLAQNRSKIRLKEKFLDRVAELFARQKTSPKCKSRPPRPDADHVAAAVWVEKDDILTIYVSKNGGFDSEDELMRHRLEIWIRAVDNAGYRPDSGSDAFWKLMLRYWGSRLRFYRQRLLDSLPAASFSQQGTTPLEQKLADLRRRLANEADPTPSSLGHMVDLAHTLKYESGLMGLLESKKLNADRLWQNIALLGRLKAIFDTLAECPMCEAKCKRLHIVKVDLATLNAKVVTKSVVPLFPNDVFSGHKDLNKVKKRKVREYFRKPLHVHAEMQLIMQVEQLRLQKVETIKYMGCSKRTCFLCCKSLTQQPVFQHRGTHGKVYYQWTMPEVPGLSILTICNLEMVLKCIENEMIDRLETFSSPKPQMLAETVTEASINPPSAWRLQQLRLKPSQSQKQANPRPRRDPPVVRLGKCHGSLKALRIPAKVKEAMELVTLKTFCNFERNMMRFDVKGQDPKTLNGEYQIYWCQNENLPENAYLKRMLKPDLSEHQHFWHGDVFVIRFGEMQDSGNDFDRNGNALYEDVHPAILESPFIPAILKRLWETNDLDEYPKRQAEYQASEQKFERDKHIVLARMTHIEREVLKWMPPGYLDYRTIHERDQDALISSDFRPSEKDGLVEIHVVRKMSKLDELNWRGFSSKDL